MGATTVGGTGAGGIGGGVGPGATTVCWAGPEGEGTADGWAGAEELPSRAVGAESSTIGTAGAERMSAGIS